MSRIDIRLNGLAKLTNGGNKNFFEVHTGYNLVRDGDDWLIPKNDPRLIAGPRDCLSVSRPLPLHQDFAGVADVCVASLSEGFENYKTKAPNKIQLNKKYGLSTEFHAQCLRYFFSSRHELKSYLIGSLFPFMKKEFNSMYVVPVFINAKEYQLAISLSKISYLMTEFDEARVRSLINNERGLDAIIPSPAFVLGYYDAFMMISPWVIAIPIDRVGSALYFLSDKMVEFPYVATTNLIEQMQGGSDPMVLGHTEILIGKLLSGSLIRKYFSVISTALHSTLKMLNDPRYFVDENGDMDFKRQLLTQSGFRLIFHEIAEVGVSGSQYMRQRLSFSVIDKYANLKWEMSAHQINESKIFEEVFSEEFRDRIISIYRTHFGTESIALGNKMISLVHQIYSSILNRKKGGKRTLLEIHGLRNMNHGIFLHRNQFSNVFIDGDGAMPNGFIYLPYLLGIAMLLDPGRMLGINAYGGAPNH